MGPTQHPFCSPEAQEDFREVMVTGVEAATTIMVVSTAITTTITKITVTIIIIIVTAEEMGTRGTLDKMVVAPMGAGGTAAPSL